MKSRNRVTTYAVRITWLIADIEDKYHGPRLHKDGDADASFHFRNSDKYYHDPEECELFTAFCLQQIEICLRLFTAFCLQQIEICLRLFTAFCLQQIEICLRLFTAFCLQQTAICLSSSLRFVLSYDESKSRRVSERAFMTLFGQDNETFISTMFLYVDQLQNQLDKDEFQEDKSMAAFWVLNNQFQKFIDWQYFLDYDSEMTEKLFAEYTGIQMQSRESKDVLSKALDASLVVTECSRTKSDEHITSSSSGTYITHVVDADIRPVNDQVLSAEVHVTAQHNVLANEQLHTDQSDQRYDTYLLEKSVENADLKSQIQEKVFVNAALKNELRKLKGNRVDTKFAKASILGKLPLQPSRNHSVLNQLTPHYLPKVQEYVLAKPHHVIAPGLSKNSQEESYGSNDMAHNHYLEEARKKTQERNRNSKPSVMPSIFSGHRFSPKKTFAVYEKTSPRSCLRWKPTGKIFTAVGLKWIPKGKLLDSCTSKVLEQTPKFKPWTSMSSKWHLLTILYAPLFKEKKGVHIRPAPTFLTPGQISSGLVLNSVLATPYVPPTNKELEILFQPMFDEYMEPPHVERQVSPAPAVLVPANSAGTPSSTTIDQDAPSPSHSPSSSAFQYPSLHKGIAADSTLMEDNPFAPVDNHPFINVFAPEPSSEASSSGDLSSAESPYVSRILV
ncbi:hypothetical protein Tco_0084253 [Tanacetum coccineum]